MKAKKPVKTEIKGTVKKLKKRPEREKTGVPSSGKKEKPPETKKSVIDTKIKKLVEKVEKKIKKEEEIEEEEIEEIKKEEIEEETKKSVIHGEKKIIDLGASDLHLSEGHQPVIRSLGGLQKIDMPAFQGEIANDLIKNLLSGKQQKELKEKLSIDFMYTMMAKDGPPNRFRSNAYYHRTGMNIVMRLIPNKIPTFRELGMPDIVAALGRFSQGLILVTGSSGSGKTTTLAALIDLINTERNDNIITIEDPIEFIHKPMRCIIRQRQIGIHTKNYNRALKSSIREDSDVIMVSELKDLETIQLAMTAAETGCLVLSSMSTTNASRTIDRIIDTFPADQRLQAGAMLSESLRGVVSQKLVPSLDGTKRLAAVEILVGCTPLVSLIREQKTSQVHSLITTSGSIGMQTMDASLLNLYKKNLISLDIAREAGFDKTMFKH